jgi:hypothetical protein
VNWARITLVLLVLTVTLVAQASLQAASCPGRFWGNHCWYRVYYRPCPTACWKCYGSYNDCQKAQEVVSYLQFEGCEAYFQGI